MNRPTDPHLTALMEALDVPHKRGCYAQFGTECMCDCDRPERQARVVRRMIEAATDRTAEWIIGDARWDNVPQQLGRKAVLPVAMQAALAAVKEER